MSRCREEWGREVERVSTSSIIVISNVDIAAKYSGANCATSGWRVRLKGGREGGEASGCRVVHLQPCWPWLLALPEVVHIC